MSPKAGNRLGHDAPPLQRCISGAHGVLPGAPGGPRGSTFRAGAPAVPPLFASRTLLSLDLGLQGRGLCHHLLQFLQFRLSLVVLVPCGFSLLLDFVHCELLVIILGIQMAQCTRHLSFFGCWCSLATIVACSCRRCRRRRISLEPLFAVLGAVLWRLRR